MTEITKGNWDRSEIERESRKCNEVRDPGGSQWECSGGIGRRDAKGGNDTVPVSFNRGRKPVNGDGTVWPMASEVEDAAENC